jgi:thiamine biosynthesis lipoprotein
MSPEGGRQAPILRWDGALWRGEFQAMASPCHVLSEAMSEKNARDLLNEVAAETWRIEDKFSRYVRGNIVDEINTAAGRKIVVDDETANLLDFADSLCDMSEGRFDITSGGLRSVWKFDGSDNVPTQAKIDAAGDFVGWHKVQWKKPSIMLATGMEIDFGGIGKEYAVDRAAAIASERSNVSSLLNFGGDLIAIGDPPKSDWRVGIESVAKTDRQAERIIHLRNGALATSGDARRFLIRDGVRFGHVLDPMTGWPVENAPRSVTVAADTCTQAGMLATLSILRGSGAEKFLEEQEVQYWCLR